MEIILPRGAEQPKFRCLLCRKGFYADEHRAYERHVVACARDREQEIAEMSKRSQGPFSDAAGFDTELEEYMRRTGKSK